jgi:hypothetical protein
MVVFKVNSAFKIIQRPCCLLCRSTNDPAAAVVPGLSCRRADTLPSATAVLPLSMKHFPLYGGVSFASVLRYAQTMIRFLMPERDRTPESVGMITIGQLCRYDRFLILKSSRIARVMIGSFRNHRVRKRLAVWISN